MPKNRTANVDGVARKARLLAVLFELEAAVNGDCCYCPQNATTVLSGHWLTRVKRSAVRRIQEFFCEYSDRF